MNKFDIYRIKNILDTIKEMQAMGLYALCREDARGILSITKSAEFIGLIDNYLASLDKVQTGQMEKSDLYKQFVKLYKYAESIKQTKTEVVFLPYCLAMWDSFESVYFAARNDPGCNAVVVPIPYYTLKADGSFNEMFCDKDIYPPDIPVVDWREYSIKEIRPDIVYVHNHFDHCNTVTSVHPDFYSYNLKPYTDLLVYISYGLPSFFIKSTSAESAEKTDKKKEAPSFLKIPKPIAFPAFSYYDVNIMPDRSVYGVNDNEAALGSPKYDKVLYTKREDCDIPREWESIIGDKKIVLYNTSLSAFLSETAYKYLIKLNADFEQFHNRRDIVLWWRPHPLFAATAASMRPTVVKIYNKIVNNFIKQKQGIYDNTPDLHRAIAMSDAYYGDMSSVVNLYGLTGKPIIIRQTVPAADKSEESEWVLEYNMRRKEELTTADYIITEQPAENGAYTFLSGFLKEHTIVPGQKETFVKTYVNADGTVGIKTHNHVMNALGKKRGGGL